MTVRDDCAVSACSSPHQTPVYKCSHPLLFGGWGKSAFGQMSATPGPLPFSCCLKQSKFSFPPSWPAYWLLSGEQSDTLCVPFGNNERWHMYLFSARGSNWRFPLESCRPHYIQCPDFQLSYYLSDEIPSYEEASVTGRKVNQVVLTKFSSQDELCVCVLTQSCLTLCDPMACSLPGSSVHGISQARKLEWAAKLSSRGSSWPRDQTCVSCIGRQIFTTASPGKPRMGWHISNITPSP